jgi:hypothetical protein
MSWPRAALRANHEGRQGHQYRGAVGRAFVSFVTLVVMKAWVPAFAGMSGQRR